jgi:hypothetical protein
MKKLTTQFMCVLAAACLASCQDSIAPVQSREPLMKLAFGQNVNVSFSQSQNLQSIIDGASTGDTITLGAGSFSIADSLLIHDKSNLLIRGAGQGTTTLLPASAASAAFWVGNNVHGLTISDLTIHGQAPLAGNTHGIAMGGSTSNVSGITFKKLEVLEVGVGISVAGTTCDSVVISDNKIVGVRSRLSATPGFGTSGSGYGIHNDDCRHVRIAENYIEDTERHGIYQAKSAGPVVIEHNLILNHLRSGTIQRDNYLVALTVTNTSDASVAFNTIVNPYADALSVEYDAARPGTTSNVQLIGNSVVGARFNDVFITWAGPIQFWGNKFYHRGTIGPTGTPIVYPAANASALHAPTGRWAGTQMLDGRTPSDSMYVLQNGVLHLVTKAYGSDVDSWNYLNYTAGPLSNVQAIAADFDGVFIMQSNGQLNEGFPNYPWWVFTPASTTNWFNFEAMTMSGGQLYVVQNGALHHVNKSDYSYNSPAPRSGWAGTQALVGFNGRLFLMQSDWMHEVDPNTLWYIPGRIWQP